MSGTSDDGALVLFADTHAGFASGSTEDATFDGTAGTFDWLVGPDGAVAVMDGQDSTSLFAGGFAIVQ